MAENSVVSIYGDSIMRGTVIDKSNRYHSTIGGWLRQLGDSFGLIFNNRAHFGITVQKGQQLLERDLKKGLDSKYVLLEFGGNDCSFDWEAVAQSPLADHRPATEPEEFGQRLMVMALQVRQNGATPVLMTLPPLDAERHLDFISRDGGRDGILRWLGDVQMIYRFHELYSSAIVQVAKVTRSLLVDVRGAFLDKHNLRQLVGEDGVHPSPEGYRLICSVFDDFITQRRKMQPVPV